MSEGDRRGSTTGGEPAPDPPDVTWCVSCGSRIDPTAWHLVETRVDDDDAFHLLSFCSSQCRRCWRDWTDGSDARG